jgi:transcriptional regulator with XRE-family HTH domain
MAGDDSGSSGNNGSSPVTHFGRQMRKERLARGWSIHELGKRTGIAAGHLSRIENGKRPPTENIADACDAVFPERRGWFTEYYQESRTWAPAGFRDWPEYENKAARLLEWSPGIITGLLQTEEYAQGLLAVHPGVTSQIVAARLANRMERQRRVLFRDDPPTAVYLMDHAALYRLVGSPGIMAGQMRHLAEVASMPNVTVQILPAVAHPATQSGFMIADDAAYTEHVLGGLVFTEVETVTGLERIFDTLRSECYRASESAAIIGKAAELWTGESRVTAAATAATASRPPATAG